MLPKKSAPNPPKGPKKPRVSGRAAKAKAKSAPAKESPGGSTSKAKKAKVPKWEPDSLFLQQFLS